MRSIEPTSATVNRPILLMWFQNHVAQAALNERLVLNGK
jgi:hypothetical protein